MKTERLDSGKMIVNFDNINVMKFKHHIDRFEIYLQYRPKIKVESIKILKEFVSQRDMEQFFIKKDIFILGEYLINVGKISITTETPVDEMKMVEITFYFQDSAPLVIRAKRDLWAAFKSYRLV